MSRGDRREKIFLDDVDRQDFIIAYSDPLTPGVAFTYDRLGRQFTVTQNGTVTTHAYNLAGELLSESYSGGTLGGFSVTNGYDQFLRRTNLAALRSGNVLAHHATG